MTNITKGKFQKQPENGKELIYNFKNVTVKCHLDSGYFTESDRISIQDALIIASREISIDKTYVDYKGTKYEKTFISEDGWNSLSMLVKETDFGRKTTDRQKDLLHEAFSLMIVNYMYDLLEDLGYDSSGMLIEMDSSYGFEVEYEYDTYEEWKRYPGKWQTW